MTTVATHSLQCIPFDFLDLVHLRWVNRANREYVDSLLALHIPNPDADIIRSVEDPGFTIPPTTLQGAPGAPGSASTVSAP